MSTSTSVACTFILSLQLPADYFNFDWLHSIQPHFFSLQRHHNEAYMTPISRPPYVDPHIVDPQCRPPYVDQKIKDRVWAILNFKLFWGRAPGPLSLKHVTLSQAVGRTLCHYEFDHHLFLLSYRHACTAWWKLSRWAHNVVDLTNMYCKLHTEEDSSCDPNLHGKIT